MRLYATEVLAGTMRRINPFEHFNIVMLATAIFFLTKKPVNATVYSIPSASVPNFSRDIAVQLANGAVRDSNADCQNDIYY